MPALPDTRDGFLDSYRALLQGFDRAASAPGGYELERCVDCANCVFCTDCARCHNCRYATTCSDSYQLTHCTSCRRCFSSTFCFECDDCSVSNFLLYCSSCSECDYCFGCVGLHKADFHILNQRVPRSQYFKIVGALCKELGVPPTLARSMG